MSGSDPSSRGVAVMIHPGREDALDAAADFVVALHDRGVATWMPQDRLDELRARVAEVPVHALSDPGGASVELMLVFGGDGTILRGAEWAMPKKIPVLGVNLGHVGFLAELEAHQMSTLVDQVVARDFQIEARLTLAVQVRDHDSRLVWTSFAINEVSVEKSSRERMLEVLAIVDHRPVSQWSCDGVLVSTPTGSTAYAFSAGGPVVWPDVEALVLVPLSAHALFARPLVLSPNSTVELDVVESEQNPAVVWCDGRRTVDVAPGCRITMVRGEHDLLLARLSEQPFSDRLVKKFDLRVQGWRRRQKVASETDREQS